jgi:two-component system sensor histidine kinase HupT/HoxJ
LEVNFKDASGAPVPVDVSCTVRSAGNGRFIGHVLVGRPLGELQHAYRQLHEAHEALKRTQQQLLHAEMASLGRLVAGVAHELNNPISFVLANAHVLGYGKRCSSICRRSTTASRKPAFTPCANSCASTAAGDLPSLIEGSMEGAQRTADIVSALKRFSAVDREALGEVDLNEVIERAIHWVCRGVAPDLQVHWQAADTPPVRGNAGQLLQVLMNLMQNAYDAAQTANQAARTVWIDVTQAPGWVTAATRQRPGIAEEHLGQVFDPFFSTKPVGTGWAIDQLRHRRRCGGRMPPPITRRAVRNSP